MLITVTNVDNEQASKQSLTFVNEFRAQNRCRNNFREISESVEKCVTLRR